MNETDIIPVEWREGKVRFLDQTLLPGQEIYIETDDVHVVAEAIKRLAVRGAPLIGITAAYGIALAMLKCPADTDLSNYFDRTVTLLGSTRPTPVNLFWALQRLQKIFLQHRSEGLKNIQRALLNEARAIHAEDAEMCRSIGLQGATLLPEGVSVLTHCNTGRLATGGIGTALGVIETGWEQGRVSHVYIDETRPLLQGARLTAWELGKLKIPATLVVDSAAGFLMKQGKVGAVVVGADRIAANGDVANKIGTYTLAVLAKHHEIPFYVAAPSSTLDVNTLDGNSIPIEQRKKSEVSSLFDRYADRHADGGTVSAENPAFDITPHELISALITEQGVIEHPSRESLAASIRKASPEGVSQ